MNQRDWLRITLAFTILSLLWATGGFVVASNYNAIRANQERLENLSVRVTASLCLQAYAPEEGDPSEADLVHDYVTGKQIPLDQFGPDCRLAIEQARAQLKGD